MEEKIKHNLFRIWIGVGGDDGGVGWMVGWMDGDGAGVCLLKRYKG